MSHELQRYRDEAIRFSARRRGRDPGQSMRVARTLVTCGTAVTALNHLGVPAEVGSVYRYVNVHDPRCPLSFSAEEGRWACADGFDEHPVWGINWAGAGFICQHMGGRLPLEREWECFASNNEPTRKYPWGNEPPTHLLANFGEHYGGTSRVCRFPASELGLFDLAGNLSEWCHDTHVLPGGQRALFERVAKGGAWSKDAHHLEITASRGKWERLGTTTIGFRPVWDD